MSHVVPRASMGVGMTLQASRPIVGTSGEKQKEALCTDQGHCLRGIGVLDERRNDQNEVRQNSQCKGCQHMLMTCRGQVKAGRGEVIVGLWVTYFGVTYIRRATHSAGLGG